MPNVRPHTRIAELTLDLTTACRKLGEAKSLVEFQQRLIKDMADALYKAHAALTFYADPASYHLPNDGDDGNPYALLQEAPAGTTARLALAGLSDPMTAPSAQKEETNG